jgi:hypothetical protein
MSPETTPSLYEQVVAITYEYLGPAADRFITRQIRNHLNKEPERLQKKDLQDLADWIRLAMSLLSNDDRLVERYMAELQALIRPRA